MRFDLIILLIFLLCIAASDYKEQNVGNGHPNKHCDRCRKSYRRFRYISYAVLNELLDFHQITSGLYYITV